MISLMKIISYNVNGIRAALRKGLDEWLQKAAPDVLCIQESKAQPEQIDQAYFAELGYQSHWHSAQKKGYSGVGILSRQAPDYVAAGTGLDYIDQEGRVLRADFGDLTVLSVYVPSGTTGGPRQEVKMRFLEDFQRYVLHLRASRPQLVLCGDFNICHTEIDIHNPKQNQNTSGFLPEERAWVSQFLEQGFIDAVELPGQCPGAQQGLAHRLQLPFPAAGRAAPARPYPKPGLPQRSLSGAGGGGVDCFFLF
jgi:exodeoxyribonuclease-3